MKTIYLIIILLLTCALFFQSGLAQDYKRWDLPEGAITRFDKGSLQGVTFSSDGNRLVVVSSIGLWVYDGHTGKELDLITGDMHSIDRIAFSLDSRVVQLSVQTKKIFDCGTQEPDNT